MTVIDFLRDDLHGVIASQPSCPVGTVASSLKVHVRNKEGKKGEF